MARQGVSHVLVAVVAAVILALGLVAGCSSSQSAAPSSQPSAAATQPSVKPTQATPQGEVVVRFVAPSGATVKSWAPQIDKFNAANKGKYRVEAESEAKDPLLQKLATQFISGTPTFYYSVSFFVGGRT